MPKGTLSDQGSRDKGIHPWLCTTGLVALCLIVWHQTVSIPFHFDDLHTIRTNKEIRDIDSCRTFLADFFDRGLLKTGFALTYAASETKLNGEPEPRLFHVVNLVIHTMNCVLAFWLARYILIRRRPDSMPLDVSLTAAMIAAIFAVHPLHTTTVYIACNRAVLQAAMFGLGTVLLAAYAADPDRRPGQRAALAAGAVAALFCSVASKAVGIATVGFAAIVIHYLHGNERRPRPGRGAAISIAAIAALTAAAIALLNRSNQVWQRSYHGIWANLLTQSGVIMGYIRLTVWPSGLNVDHNVDVTTSILSGNTILWMLAIAVLLAVSIALTYRRHWLGLCILWFFIALAPTSSFIPRKEIMVEYRMYLAMLGFAAISVGVLLRAAGGRKSLAVILVVLHAAALSAATFVRTEVFLDPVKLWADSAEKAPDKGRTHLNLGIALTKQGRLDEAVVQFKESVRFSPDNVGTYNNLAATLGMQGKTEEAIKYLRMAIEVDSRHAESRSNLGMALTQGAEHEEAIEHLKIALELTPEDPEVHVYIGYAYFQHGDFDKAIEHLSKAIELNPNNIEAHGHIARVYAIRNDFDLSKKHSNIVKRLKAGGRTEF